MRKLVVAATAAALLVTPTVANAASPTMAQFNALKRQVNALRNQVVDLRRELNCFSDEVFPIEQFGGPGPPPEGYVYGKGAESFLTTGLDYPEQGGPYDFLAVAYDPACLSSGRASLASLPLVKPRMPLHPLHG